MNDFDILELAKKLRFTGIPDTLMARVEQARSASLSYDCLLYTSKPNLHMKI